MKYQFIDAEKTNFPITIRCDVMGVSRSGFYAFKQRVPKNDALMRVTIKSIHSESKGTYGAPRIHRALRNQGFVIGHNRVSQMMRDLNISGIPKRRRNRSRSKKVQEGQNLLQRNFGVNAPNKVWCVDISYISTRQGWLYLTVVIDLFSRWIVGYEMDNHQRISLPLAALKNAINSRTPSSGLIHHSDRGSQYLSEEYLQTLEKHQFKSSLNMARTCLDNAVVESFFSSLKQECVYRHSFKSRTEAREYIVDYIDNFYNAKRQHSANQGLSPMEFEHRFRCQNL